MPLRQTTGVVVSLLKVAGPVWPKPDFSVLSYPHHRPDIEPRHAPDRKTVEIQICIALANNFNKPAPGIKRAA